MRQLVRRLLRPSISAGVLLIVTLACYTPRQIQAQREAIAQFALLEESIYVPPDADLLAEVHFSGRSNVHAFAGVERIYVITRSCEEIITEYKETMADSGWTAGPAGSCDQVLWLRMVTSQAGFGVYAEPPEESRLAEEWRLLQDKYGRLYYVSSSLGVEY